MEEKLAIDGGTSVKTTKNPPMYPGGLEIGEEEKSEILDVLEHKYCSDTTVHLMLPLR